MNDLNPGTLRRLREMAQKGEPPSRILRDVIRTAGPTDIHKVTLIQYLREAFALSLQQASPIAGWAADGSGELDDARLDALLAPEISKNRRAWESLDVA